MHQQDKWPDKWHRFLTRKTSPIYEDTDGYWYATARFAYIYAIYKGNEGKEFILVSTQEIPQKYREKHEATKLEDKEVWRMVRNVSSSDPMLVAKPAVLVLVLLCGGLKVQASCCHQSKPPNVVVVKSECV